MNKLLLTVLLFVFVCGCTPPLTLNQERTKMFAVHPEWTSEMKATIVRGVIVEGMSVEQVQLAWGCNLYLDYASSGGYAVYESCVSTYDPDLEGRNNPARAFMNGMKRGTGYGCKKYRFDFRYGKLESWHYFPERVY